MENQIYILLHSQADSKYLFCIICELNIVVVLNEKYISMKQRSVIIRLCLVYKCMKKKQHLTEMKSKKNWLQSLSEKDILTQFTTSTWSNNKSALIKHGRCILKLFLMVTARKSFASVLFKKKLYSILVLSFSGKVEKSALPKSQYVNLNFDLYNQEPTQPPLEFIQHIQFTVSNTSHIVKTVFPAWTSVA